MSIEIILMAIQIIIRFSNENTLFRGESFPILLNLSPASEHCASTTQVTNMPFYETQGGRNPQVEIEMGKSRDRSDTEGVR